MNELLHTHPRFRFNRITNQRLKTSGPSAYRRFWVATPWSLLVVCACCVGCAAQSTGTGVVPAAQDHRSPTALPSDRPTPKAKPTTALPTEPAPDPDAASASPEPEVAKQEAPQATSVPVDPEACRAHERRETWYLKRLRKALREPLKGEEANICDALDFYHGARAYYDAKPDRRLELGAALARVYSIRKAKDCLKECVPNAPCPDNLTEPDRAWKAHQRIVELLEQPTPDRCPRRRHLEKAAVDYFVVLARVLHYDDARLVQLLDNVVLLRPGEAMRQIIQLARAGKLPLEDLRKLLESLDATNLELLAPLAKRLASAAQGQGGDEVPSDALLQFAEALGQLASKKLQGEQLAKLSGLLKSISSNKDLRRLVQLGELYDMTSDPKQLGVVNAAIRMLLLTYPDLEKQYDADSGTADAESVRHFLSLLDETQVTLLNQHVRDIGAWVVVEQKLKRLSLLFSWHLPCAVANSAKCLAAERFWGDFLSAFNPRAQQHLQPVQVSDLAPSEFLERAKGALEEPARCSQNNAEHPIFCGQYAGALVLELGTPDAGATLVPRAAWTRKNVEALFQDGKLVGQALVVQYADPAAVTSAAIRFAVDVVQRMNVGRNTSPEVYCPDVEETRDCKQVQQELASAKQQNQQAKKRSAELTQKNQTLINQNQSITKQYQELLEKQPLKPSRANVLWNAGYPYLADDTKHNDGCGKVFAWLDTGSMALAIGSAVTAILLGANTKDPDHANAANGFWWTAVGSGLVMLGTKGVAMGKWPDCSKKAGQQ